MPTLKDSDVATAGVRSSPETSRGGQAWTLLSLLVALIALWGSLYLSLGMGLKACPLCYYQRTFVMGALGVLGIGWLAGARPSGILELLALPCAVGGLGVAVFHEYLEQTGKLECPAGILGLGTAPQQSLGVLVLLTIVLILGLVRGGNHGGRKFVSTGGAIILGVLFAFAAVRSAAPAKIPQEPYKETLDICRPPYHPE
jgi:disulfide bond formation protein DsbB